ncbi:AGAP000234-PA-like protein [Anopheles sinensis]|uniref:AGAP000234-PA-like protein n=1 Tax=Anopheles sinensis TaxID=74873 RepID=A0A084VLN4_ANOSI|nr:AGAP000234-PA-like protein [Anopheles sinensis]
MPPSRVRLVSWQDLCDQTDLCWLATTTTTTASPYAAYIELELWTVKRFDLQYPFDNLSRYLLTHPGDGTAQESVTTSAGAVQSERPEPSWTLPEAVDRLPPAERDLLQRLLQPVPEKRLRSLLQLQRIAIYQHYRWDDVRNFKMKPQSYIQHSTLDYETTQEMFSDFL